MRKTILAAALTAAVSLQAAVAGGGQEQPQAQSRRNQGTGIEKLAEAKPAPVADIEGYRVRTAAWWNGPDDLTEVGRLTQKLWREAEAEYDVTMEWVQMANPRVLTEKMVATIMLGEPVADIIYIEGASIPTLVEANMILPLDEYFTFDGPDSPIPVRYKGRVYGFVPYSLGGGDGIWYNRTLFQREGLPDLYELQERGEWTWEKYFEIAKAATKDLDGDGKTDQWGLAIGYEIEYPIIWSNGGRIVTETDAGFVFSMDDPAVIEALDFMSRIYRENITSVAGESLFIAGRAAMYGGALFQGANLMANMQDEYGWVFYPKGPRADDYISMGGAGNVAVFPANLNYPPERLARIAVDTIPFEQIPAIQQEFLEGALTRSEDFRTVEKMTQRGGDTDWKDAFPGLLRVSGDVFRKIRRGTSAATAVEENKLQGQAAIDALFK